MLVNENLQQPFLQDQILTGKKAETVLNFLLKNNRRANYKFSSPYVTGYYNSHNGWIAFDNTQGQCFIEICGSEALARRYCIGGSP